MEYEIEMEFTPNIPMNEKCQIGYYICMSFSYEIYVFIPEAYRFESSQRNCDITFENHGYRKGVNYRT